MPQKKKEESLSLVPQKVINETVERASTDLESLTPLTKRLNALKMNSDKNFQIVMDEGRKVKDVQRQVEKKQKGLTSQCDKMKKEIKGLFAPMMDCCQEVLDLVETKRSEYDDHLEKQHEIERKKAEAEAEAERKRLQKNANARAKRVSSEEEAKEIRHSVGEVEARKVEKEAPAKIAGVSTAKLWYFEVVDPDTVPKKLEFVTGEEFTLWRKSFSRAELLNARKHLEACGENVEEVIPGVRFYQEDSTRYGRL